MTLRYGPLPSLKGCELWAPVLKVVSNGAIVDLQGLKNSPYWGNIGSTLDHSRFVVV